MERIELEGVITVGDTARFVYYHQLRKTWWYLLPLILLAASMLGLSILAWVLLGTTDLLRNAGGPMAVVLCFWGWCFGWAPYRYAQKILGKHAASGEAVKLAFDESGIDWQGPNASSHMGWEAVEYLDETRTLYLLYIGPVAAIRVPKRFFSNAARMETWRTLVGERLSGDKVRPRSWIGRYI
jgi:hypothetical protein